jgi:hypothetical protein
MMIGGISMIIGGLLNFIITDTPDESASEIVEEIMTTEQTPPAYL